MTLTRVWIPSPNYSQRNANVRLIVIHSSEGATTYQSLGNFFANPSSQVSSHVGIDDTPNTIGEYVNGANKAWTAANANPVAVQAELCTPSGASATWSSAIWNSHPVMLANLSTWIREEAAHFNIPVVRLTPSQAQTNGRGVCQHSDLGSWGGGHVDCGPGFPIDTVIANAAGGAPQPGPPEEPEMILIHNSRGEYSTFDGTKRLRVSGPSDLTALRAAGVKDANPAVSDAFYNSVPLSK